MQASFPLGSKRKIQDLCVAKTRAWSLNVPYAKEIFKKHGLTCEGWCLLKWGHAFKCMRMCICIHIGKRNLFTGADCGTRPQILMHLLSHAIVILHMCWAPLWALCSHLLGSGRCELDKMALISFPMSDEIVKRTLEAWVSSWYFAYTHLFIWLAEKENRWKLFCSITLSAAQKQNVGFLVQLQIPQPTLGHFLLQKIFPFPWASLLTVIPPFVVI